jgi:hypothetical protein
VPGGSAWGPCCSKWLYCSRQRVDASGTTEKCAQALSHEVLPSHGQGPFLCPHSTARSRAASTGAMGCGLIAAQWLSWRALAAATNRIRPTSRPHLSCQPPTAQPLTRTPLPLQPRLPAPAARACSNQAPLQRPGSESLRQGRMTPMLRQQGFHALRPTWRAGCHTTAACPLTCGVPHPCCCNCVYAQPSCPPSPGVCSWAYACRLLWRWHALSPCGVVPGHRGARQQQSASGVAWRIVLCTAWWQRRRLLREQQVRGGVGGLLGEGSCAAGGGTC